MVRRLFASAFGPAALAGAALVMAGAGARAGAADGDAVDAITPYRPSVSSPAQLPVPGQLEFELGGLRMRSDATRRSSVPYLFKLAFDPSWGLLIGGEAHVWARDDGGRAQGLGDTNVVLKRAWIVDDATALGMEFNAKLPTASDAIGSGKADYTVNTIFSRDLGPVHMDANFNGTRLGLVDAGASRTQLGASAAFSGAVSDHWGVTGELSGTHRSGADQGTQLLSALTYSPSKRLTFDMGVARAMRPRPATTQVFAGVVVPIAKLW
jgi:hypothetical protein